MRELKSLGTVQGHKEHLVRIGIDAVYIGYQRHFFKKTRQCGR